MAAPKKNEFWKLRSKHGRDKIFKTPEILWEAACEYFQYITDNPIETYQNLGTKNVNKVKLIRPFTLIGLCIYLDVNAEYIAQFERAVKLSEKKIDKEFTRVIRKIRQIIDNQKFEGATVGLFKENIIARDLGLKDKSDITSNDNEMQPRININYNGKDIDLSE